jgi:hypothetical protein
MSSPASLPVGVGRAATTPLPRYALGLPAGSIRAILAFMVFGLIWALLLIPEPRPVPIPLYLYYLMFLILGHYFAARGHTHVPAGSRERPPLYLPRGTIRFLIFAGFAAVVGWGLYNDPRFAERLQPDVKEQPYLLLVIVGAFFVGIVVSAVGKRLLTGPEGLPFWFQDLEAWVALLAVLGLIGATIIHLVINPSVAPEQRLNLPNWEGFLGALVAFYFGARS